MLKILDIYTVTNKTMIGAINYLILVLGSYSSIRNLAVVHTPGVEPLELPVLVVAHLLLHLLLSPVHVSGLGCESSNVESHEGRTSAHDEEERLQSFVMSEGLDCDSLHGPNSVVSPPSSKSIKIWMISSAENSGEEHFYVKLLSLVEVNQAVVPM